MSNTPIVTPSLTEIPSQVLQLLEDNVDNTPNTAAIKAFIDVAYIGDTVGRHLVAWATFNPNIAVTSEVSYRSGNRRGIKIYNDIASTPDRITVERSDAAGDDFIGESGWIPNNSAGYYIEIAEMMQGNSQVERLIVQSWGSGNSPNTGLPGYLVLNWVNTGNGSFINGTPAGHDGGSVTILVYKLESGTGVEP